MAHGVPERKFSESSAFAQLLVNSKWEELQTLLRSNPSSDNALVQRMLLCAALKAANEQNWQAVVSLASDLSSRGCSQNRLSWRDVFNQENPDNPDNPSPSFAVRKLFDCMEFGAKDFCCVTTAKAAAEKRLWDIVDECTKNAEALAAKDMCRFFAIGAAVKARECGLVTRILEEIQSSDLKRNCLLDAVQKLKEYVMEDNLMKLMEIAETTELTLECFKIVLTLNSNHFTKSNQILLLLLTKVTYSAKALRCYAEVVKFAFRDLDNEQFERWGLLCDMQKLARESRLGKLRSSSESADDSVWSFIMDCLIMEPDDNQQVYYNALKVAIQHKKWSVVCQIVQILGTGRIDEAVEYNSSFQDVVARFLELKSSNAVLGARCSALLFCLASEECKSEGLGQSQIADIVKTIINRYNCMDQETIEIMRCFIQSTREFKDAFFYSACSLAIEYSNWSLVCNLFQAAESKTKLTKSFQRYDLDDTKKIVENAKETEYRNFILSKLPVIKTNLYPSECAVFERQNQPELIRCDERLYSVSVRNTEFKKTPCCSLSFSRNEEENFDTTQEETIIENEQPSAFGFFIRFFAEPRRLSRTVHRVVTRQRIVTYECCICQCNCKKPMVCGSKLIDMARNGDDWNSVVRIAMRHKELEKKAVDYFLNHSSNWLKSFSSNEEYRGKVSVYLHFVRLSVRLKDVNYVIQIINLFTEPDIQGRGILTAVGAALDSLKDNTALIHNLILSAMKHPIFFAEQCCNRAYDGAFHDSSIKEFRKELLQIAGDICPVVKGRLMAKEKSETFTNPVLSETNVTFRLGLSLQKIKNYTCRCGEYSLKFLNERALSQGFSTMSFHPTRNSLCQMLWSIAVDIEHWQLAVDLLLEITDPDDRDVKCLSVLPKVFIKNQLRPACAILMLLSNKHEQERNMYCSKASYFIGKSETVALLKCLLRIVTQKKQKKRCHFRAFVGALRVRNVSLILFIIRSIKIDFTEPDIMHFLANEVLCGEFELIDLIFGEMKQCTEIQNESEVQTSAEFHDMIAAVLFKSMAEGHVSLASAILEYADINYRTKDGNQDYKAGTTLLIAASHCGHHELVEAILKKKARVDEEDNEGRTALCWASIGGNLRTVKVLVDGGARILHKDNTGMTCLALADSHFGRLNICASNADDRSDVVKLLMHLDKQKDSKKPRISDEEMSLELHDLLKKSGFTHQRARLQQKMADFLEQLMRDVTQEDWHLTGSYSDGWGNSLEQTNGRTASDSDIDWTVIVGSLTRDWGENEDTAKRREKLTFHLSADASSKEGCKCLQRPSLLRVEDGHAKIKRPAGSQPASASSLCGVRPAQDICHAYACCSSYRQDRVSKLLPQAADSPVHLVTATGPIQSNEMRLSFSFWEKQIMRKLTTEKGQLFVIIKFLFKRLISKTWQTSGLKTYHARTCLFFLLEQKPEPRHWQPKYLLKLLKDALTLIISQNQNIQSSHPSRQTSGALNDVCMKHFFMPDSFLYYKNAGLGYPFDDTNKKVMGRLSDILNDQDVLKHLKKHLKPLSAREFHFHPFALLPLTVPPEEFESQCSQKFALTYCIVAKCLRELQSDEWDRQEVMRLSERLPDQCKTVRFCLTVMVYLKSGNAFDAKELLQKEANHNVLRRLSEDDVKDLNKLKKDWLWRFCFANQDQEEMKFLPEYSRSLFCVKRPERGAAHLYVNFRCLWWSLGAEILGPPNVDSWYLELLKDPDSEDFEELRTLATFSSNSIHQKFCKAKIGNLHNEKRLQPSDFECMEKAKKEKEKEIMRHFGSLRSLLNVDQIIWILFAVSVCYYFYFHLDTIRLVLSPLANFPIDLVCIVFSTVRFAVLAVVKLTFNVLFFTLKIPLMIIFFVLKLLFYFFLLVIKLMIGTTVLLLLMRFLLKHAEI